MGWSSEGEVVCRRHPKEAPQPGICPSCLRERLLRIGGTTYNNISSLSSPSPVHYYCHSSGASSSGGSSPHNRRRHQRVGSDIMESIYAAISGNNGLKKSRSMAYEPRNCGSTVTDHHNKKPGFWNKLLRKKLPNKLW